MSSLHPPSNPNLVRCQCKYRCSRLPEGFDFISVRSRQYHAKKDDVGAFIDVRRLSNSAVFGLEGQPVGQSSLIGSAQICVDHMNRSQRWFHNQNALQRAFLGTSVLPSESTPSEFLDSNESRHDNININVPPLSEDLPQSANVPPLSEDPPQSANYSVHVPQETSLSLHEAIHRETIRLNSLLDEAKVPVDLQDKILRCLFEGTDRCVVNDDYRGMKIGPLLRHAGLAWAGGPFGLSSLGTFKGLEASYQTMGAPQPERWRMCLGSLGNHHEALVFGPSKQEDLNLSTSLKCSCQSSIGEKLPWVLQRDCETCTERCTFPGCSQKRKDMLKFDYIPIAPLIRKLCLSRSICHEILTMWRDRGRWLHSGNIPPENVIREWWDGSAAKEKSWFWDPTKTFELPVLCQSCYTAYQTYPQKCDLLKEKMVVEDGIIFYEFDCACGAHIKTQQMHSQGDPRNLALMAHWDGFQSARSSYRSTWTVEISILNMGIRSDMQPIPVLFIPHSQTEKLTKRKFNNLDAFLEPLIRDLQKLFVDGFLCTFSYQPEIIHPMIRYSTFRCRCQLCIFTGDHPAQCKFGGWCVKGYSACRRCCMKGTWRKHPNRSTRGAGGTVVYCGNRYLLRHPPAKRNLAAAQNAAEDIVRCTSRAQQVTISQESGISKKTKAWRLHNTFGFCLINDLVYDVMHVMALNLFKSYVENLMQQLSSSEKKILEEALAEVTANKPKSLDGRWPTDPSSRLGFFKAEEYVRFVIYCLPHILQRLGIGSDTSLGSIGMLLCEIGRLFYIQSREEGWHKSILEKARKLLASWRVRSEEAFGSNGSILEHVAGSGELLDDIERHGPHWGYWCYRFERMVSGYGRTTTNNKEKEQTYTSHHARLFFTKTSIRTWEDDDGFLPHQRALVTAHIHLRPTGTHQDEHAVGDKRDLSCPQWHERCIVVVSSQVKALYIWKNLSFSPENSYCKVSILQRGIGIGMVSKRVKKVGMSIDTVNFLEMHWAKHSVLTDYNKVTMERKVTPIKSVVVRGTLFRIGDHVVVLTDEENDVGYCWNWRAVINKFFLHEFMGCQDIFFEGNWFGIQRTNDNPPKILTDNHYGMPVLLATPESYQDNNCRPVSRLLHKFLPVPRICANGRNLAEIVCLELSDRMDRHHIEDNFLHICPTYPHTEDLVKVRSTSGLKLAVVRQVDISSTEEDGPLVDLDDEDGEAHTCVGSNGVEIMEDMTCNLESGVLATGVPSRACPELSDLNVHISWVNKTHSSRGSSYRSTRSTEEWRAVEQVTARVAIADIEGLEDGLDVILYSRGGIPIRWSSRN